MRWFYSCYTPRSHFERQVFDDAFKSSITRNFDPTTEPTGAENETFSNKESAKMLKKRRGRA